MPITVIGTGYLGAVHAACMAQSGHEVLGVDVDPARLAALREGRPPFFEPGSRRYCNTPLTRVRCGSPRRWRRRPRSVTCISCASARRSSRVPGQRT